MNLVFIGSSKFGLRCFEACLGMSELSIIGVVSAPKNFAISYRPGGVNNVLHADVAALARAHSIPVQILQRSMNEPGLFKAVQDWKPDAFLVVGWYHMVPRTWRELAPAYGLHASLLPDYSGGAPLVWAMINGEARTGITLFEFDDGVDSGPIVGSKATNIEFDDTIATLYERIENLGIQLLSDNLPLLAKGAATFRAQDESRRRLFPQRSPADGNIDWTQPASRIHDFIRAQTRPYPGAYSHFRGLRVSIWRSMPHSNVYGKLFPGQMMTYDNRLMVGCGQGTQLELLLLGDDGRDVDAAAWTAGKLLGNRDCFHR